MNIQLITFDLDDTLWDTAPVIVSAEAVLREWLSEHAPNLGAVPVEHLWAIRERVLTREPGGSDGAEAIRRLLVEGGTDRWSAETEILLFNAARRDHLERTIRPALARGATVITDRFADSTRVYQGKLGKVDLEAAGVLRPSATWTYMVHDNPFDASVGHVLEGMRSVLRKRFGRR